MARRIVLKVYERDGTTHVGDLTRDRHRQWLEELENVGAGSVTVPLGSADAALLTDGRIVKCFLDGTARFAWIVESAEIVVADDGAREAGRLVQFSGRGVLALLERAVVFPELEIGLVSPDTRFFSPASSDYDDSGWTNAVELKQVSDPAGPWAGAPAGMANQDAWWIGLAGDSTPGVPPGPRRFRKEFSVGAGAGGDHFIELACDDTWILYFDGDLVSAEQQVGVWGETRQIPRFLDEGPHQIYAECSNLPRPNPATNVFGFTLSVAPVVFGNAPGAPIVATDATWLIDDTSYVPGMSWGAAMGALLNESAARDTLDVEVSTDFTPDLDSDGTFWSVGYDVSFAVSDTTYLDVLRHYLDEHAGGVWMDPDLTLHLYDQSTGGRGNDLSGTVAIQYAVNVGRLKYSHKKLKANRVLSKTALGQWVMHEDAASIAAVGGHEVGLSLGSAPSDSAAVRMLTAFLEDQRALDAVTDCEVRQKPGATPYIDWGIGDTVSVTGPDGVSTTPRRCVALAVTDDAAGNPHFTPEMIDP